MADRSVEVVLRARVSDFKREIKSAAGDVDQLNASLAAADGRMSKLDTSSRRNANGLAEEGKAARKTASDLDLLSTRVKLYAQATAAAGPGLLPVVALAGPAIAGLSTGLAAAALGGVSLVAALQGVGDATKAVDAYNLDPTVESYEAARTALEALSPASQQFVSDWQDFQPVLTSLRDASAEGWMPGLSDSLDNLTQLAPRASDLLLDVSRAGGQALEDSTASLASDRWSEFYDLIDRQAPQTITALTEVVGDLTHGVAGLMVSSEQGANGFIGWTGEVADNFDRWSNSDKGREDVQAFLDYASTNGPKVQDFFGSLVDTVAQIAQAAAPLGGATLTALTAVSDVIGKIADSPVGTPLLAAAAGLSVFNRTAKVTTSLGASSLFAKAFPVGLRATATEARAGVPRLRDFGTALAFAAHSNDTLTKSQQSGSKVASTSVANALRARAAVLGWSKGAATAAVPIAALGLTVTGAAEGMGVSNTAAGALIGTLGGPWGMAVGAAAGGVLDLSTALTGNLTSALDQARAAAASGDLGQMRTELGDLRAEIDNTSAAGGFFSDAMHGLSFGKIDGITEARDELALLDDSIRKAQETSVRGFGTEGNGLNLLVQGLDLTAEQYDRARLAGSNFYDMVGSAGKVLDRRSQWRAYQEAIDGASAALQANGRTLDNNTDAGRANNDALDRLGSTALTFAQNLKGADRTDYLRGARNGIQQAAQDFGLGEAAARRLANEIIGVGNLKPAKPKVDLDINPWKKGKQGVDRGMGAMDGSSANPWVDLYDAPFQKGSAAARSTLRALNAMRASPIASLRDQASAAARAVANAINAIPASKHSTARLTTIYETIRIESHRDSARANGAVPHANGGYISGPGGPRDDLIPAMLSNGEFVVNAAATRNNLALLHELNAQKFADGGLAQRVAAYKSQLEPTSFFASGGEVGRGGGDRNRGDGFQLFGGRGGAGGGGGGGGRPDPARAEALAIANRIAERFDKALDRNAKALKGASGEKRRDLLEKREDILKDRWKASAEAIKKETQQRKDVTDALASYKEQVASTYRHDLFGNGLEGLQLQLEADENDARSMISALQQAAAKGLDGALYDALAASGDLNTAQQLSMLDMGGIDALERRYASSMGATAAVGTLAADTKFGDQLAEQNRVIRQLSRTLERFEVNAGRNVRDGARQGSHDGSRSGTARGNIDRDRAVTRGTRANSRGGGNRTRSR